MKYNAEAITVYLLVSPAARKATMHTYISARSLFDGLVTKVTYRINAGFVHCTSHFKELNGKLALY